MSKLPQKYQDVAKIAKLLNIIQIYKKKGKIYRFIYIYIYKMIKMKKSLKYNNSIVSCKEKYL